ncbi:hypothetical protein [Novosphingobium mangrovi (ex Huang et al. 2023)]|uniref:Uncharacterized protein n=1 Tax=Novosphingobium mangrovi (ex Huang et al. 2023) TaxID=2976432 RepID=A0ABT2I1F5_9SPHN|nr:hypothetical protein [Novosphingobium mangrovi (ex Huang et al. 2023)]MCT2398488.1 hypothetical protein [Novosphingobium mangrovi (ex Huang et al. 2023)]
MTAVTQTWTEQLTFMQQTVLLTAVRGPDGSPKYGPTKMLLRWYRRCILRSSLEDGRTIKTPFDAGGGSFMGPSFPVDLDGIEYGTRAWSLVVLNIDWPTRMTEIVSQYLRELDALPHHFQLHFMHAAEIVGYKHPDEEIRAWWHGTYLRLVHDMHLWPETEDQLDRRLGDSREQWLERNDAATID